MLVVLKRSIYTQQKSVRLLNVMYPEVSISWLLADKVEGLREHRRLVALYEPNNVFYKSKQRFIQCQQYVPEIIFGKQ